MILREERETDYYQAEWMTKKAFWNLHVPGCDEHLLVHLLRNDPAYVAPLTRVVEHEGEIIGAIYYSKAHVVYPDRTLDILTFGPLCVDPAYQNQGIGKLLLNHTLELAKNMGYKAIIILGEPWYYPKFGFQTCDHFGITTAEGKNFDAFMGLELEENYLQPGGIFHEAPLFTQLDPLENERFDQGFPYMEKRVQPGQWDYIEPIE